MTLRVPNVFDALALVAKAEKALFRKTDSSLDVRTAIQNEAADRYENIVGRFDVLDRVKSRRLQVPSAEADDVRELGAVQDEIGAWVVPDSIPDSELDTFQPWWPKVPPDLRDSTPRMLMTKNGRRIEGYVLGSDQGKGGDSTATSLIFVALPILGALTLLVSKLWAPLAILPALMTVPYLVAIAQGEKVKEAVKAGLFLYAVPLVLASGVSMPSMGSGMAGLAITGGVILSLTTAVIVGCFLMALGDGEGKVALGTAHRVKDAGKWGMVLLGAGLMTSVLPDAIAPAAIFGLACLYPMVYTNREYLLRSQLLWQQGEAFNLGTQGKLAEAHVEVRESQAKRALGDTTPLIYVATAGGYLTKKHYGYAPDEGSGMWMSMQDLTTSLMLFGNTGIGKTYQIRLLLLQYAALDFGGALITDGKGALAGEMRDIIDLMVEPGIDFAPFEGLSAQDVSIALNALVRTNQRDDDRVWESGARNFLDHATVVHEALRDHEIAYRNAAIHESRRLQEAMDLVWADIAELQRHDGTEVVEQLAAYEARLEQIEIQRSAWQAVAMSDREWAWTPANLERVITHMAQVRVAAGGVSIPGQRMLEMADYLGYDTTRFGDAETLEKRVRDREQRLSSEPNTVHPDLGIPGSLLQASLDFIFETWSAYAPEQRSSFLLNVHQKINPLLRGKHLRNHDGAPWHSMEHGMDVSQALFGKMVGVNLPTTKHGDAGRIVATLVKQRIYTGIQKRADVGEVAWRAEGQLPVLNVMDECQLLAGDAERNLLSISRSLWLMNVFATQSYEGLVATFHDEWATKQFLGNFTSAGIFQSTPGTYKWLMDRLGTAMLTTFQTATRGIDYSGGMSALINSPLNDPDHPGASAMKLFERAGGGQLTAMRPGAGASSKWMGPKLAPIDDSSVNKLLLMPNGGKREVQPLFKPEEYNALLMDKGRCIVQINRAGAWRVDFATVRPEDARTTEKAQSTQEKAA